MTKSKYRVLVLAFFALVTPVAALGAFKVSSPEADANACVKKVMQQGGDAGAVLKQCGEALRKQCNTASPGACK